MIDLFNIDFLTVTLLDILDIIIVAYIIYKLYNVLKGTIASQIFIGLVIVLLLSFTAQALELQAVNMLLRFVTEFWIIAFIILFQPEIRRLLVIVATNPLFRLGAKPLTQDTNVSAIVEAAFQMSQKQHGALIVVIKSSGMRGFSESGEIMNARVSRDLLLSIFYPRSPLHDGAVIIRDNTVEAARAALPLSSTTNIGDENLGMRHRAGLGISEQADVLSIIVSEETGSISVAENGTLEMGLSRDALRQKLNSIYQTSKSKTFGNFISTFFQKA